MNINKKFDRFRQWTDERLGAKTRTDVSQDFKDLEVEMGMRYDGMKENQKAMSAYVKNVSERVETDDKEKLTPLAGLGAAMAQHGDDFAPDSSFGACLVSLGGAHERMARAQDTYAVKATSSWLESTERSLTQMKDYQGARKKLESRRLAYDTALTKLDKLKRGGKDGGPDSFKLEEEVRVQKSKYEESSEDVHRRMLDIREAEADSVQDLSDFLDAELAYHERCLDILTQLRREWPAGGSGMAPLTRSQTTDSLSRPRSRPSTAQNYSSRRAASPEEEAPPLPTERPSIRSKTRVVSNSTPQSRADSLEPRPHVYRSTTFEGPRQLSGGSAYARDPSPLSRVATNPNIGQASIWEGRSALRPVNGLANRGGGDDDAAYDSGTSGSPASRFGGGGDSPATSVGSSAFAASARTPSAGAGGAKKPPPPPPPSRAKKPPPPPPPMKRVVTTGSIVS